MEKNFILFFIIWITIFFLSGFETVESARPGRDITLPRSTVVPAVKETTKKEEPVPDFIEKIPKQPSGERIKKLEGKTESLLIFKGKIKQTAEIKETEENEVIIVTEENKTIAITVSPMTVIVLGDVSIGNIGSLNNAVVVEAFCNPIPEEGSFIAEIIRIIE